MATLNFLSFMTVSLESKVKKRGNVHEPKENIWKYLCKIFRRSHEGPTLHRSLLLPRVPSVALLDELLFVIFGCPRKSDAIVHVR